MEVLGGGGEGERNHENQELKKYKCENIARSVKTFSVCLRLSLIVPYEFTVFNFEVQVFILGAHKFF